MVEFHKKCVCFSRVSTSQQTLESQTEVIKNEALRFGYNESDLIFIEQKESAVKLDIEERIGIQQLKQFIENDKDINCVIVYEISRLSRRPKMLYEIRDYLLNHNIQLICIKPYIKLIENGKLSSTAALIFGVFSTLAEEEARLSKERMMRGKKHKQSLGGYIGGKPLFGYKFENDKLVIDYSKSEIVKKIYNMYEKGLSTRSISLELMATGELKQTVLNTANGQVQQIISRPEYYGGKSDISGYNYPKIISKKQFDRCRQIAKDKTKEHSRVKKTCLCKKLLYCKQNDYVLSPNIAKNQYRLYTTDKSVNMTIRIDIMDKLIWDVVIEHVSKIKEDDNIKVQLEEECKVLLRKVQQALRNIGELNKQIDRIENRIIEGKMNEIKGDNLIREKQIEIKEQQSIMDDYNYLYGQKQTMIYEGTYKQDISKIENIEERQKIVRKYVNKIILEKTGEKRGHYNIEILMNNGTTFIYKFWSSGPWNNIEKIK